MTDESAPCTRGNERFEVVIHGEDGIEKNHADLLRRELIREGYHEHVVSVRSVDIETDGGESHD